MKKLIALLMALVMIFALAACGSSTAAESSTAATTTTTTTTTAATENSNWNVVRPEGLPADYPNKEITYIYPFGTGSMQDVYIRVLAEKIKEMEGWDYSIVVQQKEGASGDIGWSAFMNAKADGYTIAFAPTAQMITAMALGKSYTPDNLEYIFNMMSDPGCFGVSAKSEYTTLQELVEAAKANPGTISMGVTSVNGSEGLAVKQLMEASGAEFNFIPFDGEAEVLTAVAGGHCDAFCLNVGDCTTFLEEGSIRLLSVGSTTHSQFYPDVPTNQECGYDVVQVNSRAVAAPAGTDAAIIQYLSDCFVAAANDPDVIAQMESLNVPFDTMDHEACTAAFQSYYEGYKALWETQPWG